ncbi:hypothetical protein [Aureimonas sp. AU40]|uniref:hypothetical protein n=1 Tax=Aureimonas sp. AU40 TaxID=1637747 RepID=UPI0012E393D7|nr:hypothetical protein [Aureimonas sp. AU40]
MLRDLEIETKPSCAGQQGRGPSGRRRVGLRRAIARCSMIRPVALGSLARACALAAVLSLGPVAIASADGEGDRSYLALERAERVFEGMRRFADMQWPVLEVRDHPDSAVLARRGREVAETVFELAGARAEMLAALAATPGNVPPELGAIARRMQEAEADLSAGSSAATSGESAESTADRDHALIREVSDAMALPDLAAEAGVTGRRIKWLYESLLTEDLQALRAMSPEALEAGVKGIMAQTRKADGETTIPPLRRNLLRNETLRSLRAILVRLPPGDLATLAAFYATEEGRAKRNALLHAFQHRVDADGERFLVRMLNEKR